MPAVHSISIAPVAAEHSSCRMAAAAAAESHDMYYVAQHPHVSAARILVCAVYIVSTKTPPKRLGAFKTLSSVLESCCVFHEHAFPDAPPRTGSKARWVQFTKPFELDFDASAIKDRQAYFKKLEPVSNVRIAAHANGLRTSCVQGGSAMWTFNLEGPLLLTLPHHHAEHKEAPSKQ